MGLGMVCTQNKSLSHYNILLHSLLLVCRTTAIHRTPRGGCCEFKAYVRKSQNGEKLVCLNIVKNINKPSCLYIGSEMLCLLQDKHSINSGKFLPCGNMVIVY